MFTENSKIVVGANNLLMFIQTKNLESLKVQTNFTYSKKCFSIWTKAEDSFSLED
jgi:hypothetical protein